MRIIIRGFMSEKDRRHLVPFIATNKINAARETENPRPLFSALQDNLTVEQANRILSEEEQPDRTELFRLLISLRPDDYERLGRSDTERNAAFREVVRNGMLAAKAAIGALELI